MWYFFADPCLLLDLLLVVGDRLLCCQETYPTQRSLWSQVFIKGGWMSGIEENTILPSHHQFSHRVCCYLNLLFGSIELSPCSQSHH